MNEEDGGPAFPCSVISANTERDVKQKATPFVADLDMRDYFAIHATEEDIQRHLPTGRTVVAANALTGKTLELPEYRKREQARYAFADAMLAARQQ